MSCRWPTPSGALLQHLCVYRITGDTSILARLRDAVNAVAVAIGYCVPPTLSATAVLSRPCTEVLPRLDTIRPDGCCPNAPSSCAWRCWLSASTALRKSFPRRALRITVVRTAADEHVLLLVAHHRLG